MDLFIAILFLVLGIVALVIGFVEDSDAAAAGLGGTLFALGGLFGTIGILSPSTSPQLIDVYRGKTTLEITYKDSIPIDTTVVWKDEFDPKKKK